MSRPEQFSLILEASVQQLSTLAELLDVERAAITGNDPEALADVIRLKLAALAELEKLLVARDRLQGELGFDVGADGAERLVQQEMPHLAEIWQQFLDFCQSVEQKNVANGSLVSQNTQQTKQLLALLTGRDQERDGYTKSGENTARLSRCSFGRV